jgi:hypothetical protein
VVIVKKKKISLEQVRIRKGDYGIRLSVPLLPILLRLPILVRARTVLTLFDKRVKIPKSFFKKIFRVDAWIADFLFVYLPRIKKVIL